MALSLIQTGGGASGVAPVTIAKTSHLFLDSFTASTGMFTASQPAFTDISGSIAAGQIASGTVTWDTIGSALAALTLSNGANATTFNQTAAAIWAWVNTTIATVSSTNGSPALTLSANYWTGAASATDSWTISSGLAAGTNAASTLTIGHTGSTGQQNVVLGTSAPSGSRLTYGTGNGILTLGTGAVFSIANGNYACIGNIVTAGELAIACGGSGQIDISTTGGASTQFTLKSGTFTRYNSIATVSNGVPSEIATVDLTGQVAAITATTLYTPAATGMYRISAYLKITTPGTSPVIGPVTIAFTDGTDSVAQSQVMQLATQAGASATSNAGNTTTSTLNGSMIVWAKTGVAITYAVALTGTVGTGAYEVHLKCEAM